MKNIKKINEFFNKEENDITGLSKSEIEQLLNYAYNISNSFDSYNRFQDLENKLSLIKSIKDNQQKFQILLDKLKNVKESDLLSVPKTKN